MISTLEGVLQSKEQGRIIVNIHGVGFSVFLPASALTALPPEGGQCALFTHLHVRENALELYGFLDSFELFFFEKLISISGIGPRSALAIMGVAAVKDLAVAINEGKAELLTRASGVGKKIAERVVLELKGKLPVTEGGASVARQEADRELEETLVSLGYSKSEARGAIAKIPKEITGFKERLKEALKKRNPPT